MRDHDRTYTKTTHNLGKATTALKNMEQFDLTVVSTVSYPCKGDSVQGMRLLTISSATARRLQTNTVIRGVAFRLNYLDGLRLKVTEVNETTNKLHSPLLASFVNSLCETSLIKSASHEVEVVFTYIVDRSHEVMVGSRRRYLTYSPLNISSSGILSKLHCELVESAMCCASILLMGTMV